jgi:hypothetical protein
MADVLHSHDAVIEPIGESETFSSLREEDLTVHPVLALELKLYQLSFLWNRLLSFGIFQVSKYPFTQEESPQKISPKRLLNLIAEFYTSQINLPFYLVTSNPQLVRGNLGNWRVKRVGHGTAGSEDTRINSELTKGNSKRRLSVTLQYIPKLKSGGL